MPTILISAGHSETDPGAVGNGYKEADLAVDLRDRVAAILRGTWGLNILEDGDDGDNEPLTKAIALAKRSDVAVEFHWNAGVPAATGIEVLAKPDKKKLSQALATAVHNATGLKLRGDSGWKSDKSGQHHRLGFCEAGGVIVEVCFLSNPNDLQSYLQNRDKVAENLAQALSTAVSNQPSTATVNSSSPSDPQLSPSNTYTVQAGDTLWRIPGLFHTTVSALKQANPSITDPDHVPVGTVLRVKL